MDGLPARFRQNPADFRVTDLQPLEKNAPELLLPFYHQAVERFVLEKTGTAINLRSS